MPRSGVWASGTAQVRVGSAHCQSVMPGCLKTVTPDSWRHSISGAVLKPSSSQESWAASARPSHPLLSIAERPLGSILSDLTAFCILKLHPMLVPTPFSSLWPRGKGRHNTRGANHRESQGQLRQGRGVGLASFQPGFGRSEQATHAMRCSFQQGTGHPQPTHKTAIPRDGTPWLFLLHS